ncbi:site-specific integrase [Longispora urticae]
MTKRCECNPTPGKCKHKWICRWTADGKQSELSFDTKDEAEAKKTEIDHAKRSGNYIDPQRAKIGLLALFDKWAALGDRAGNTEQAIRVTRNTTLEPYWGTRGASAVRGEDLEAWLTWMRTKANNGKGYAENTIVGRWGMLAGCFKWGVANDYIPSQRNPFLKVAAKPSAAKARQIAKAKIYVPTLTEIGNAAGKLPEQYRLMPWLQAGSGLRISEAMAARLSDFQPRKVTVARQVVRRGVYAPLKHRVEGETRTAPVAEYVSEMLAWHIGKFGTGPNGELFQSGRSRVPSHDTVYSLWAKATTEFTPHALRHFAATTWIRAGIDIFAVSAWLGHKDPSVTLNTYGHYRPDTLLDGVDVMSKALLAA